MSETYPTPTESIENDEVADNFSVIQEWQAEDAAKRAKEMLESVDPLESNVDEKKGWNTPAKVIAGAAAGVTLAVGGPAIVENFKAPEFSESSTEYVVRDGDGIQVAAEQIEGIESIDVREAIDHIAVDPANIDVLKDGLQPGEILVIPESVEK